MAVNWKRVRQLITISEAEFASADAQIRRFSTQVALPSLVVLGKSQAGKHALMRALSDSSEAQEYYPDAATAFLRWWPLRLDQDNPAALQNLCSSPGTKVVMVLLRAADPEQEQVRAALLQIQKLRPQWPVVMVQTCLHEGYPQSDTQHLQPYAYDRAPFPPQVPRSLARMLYQQRDLFRQCTVKSWVGIDFTEPSAGYQPLLYGLKALWDALDQALPINLRHLLLAPHEAGPLGHLSAKAYQINISHAILAGNLERLPEGNASLATVVQARLCRQLLRVYQQSLTAQQLEHISSVLAGHWLSNFSSGGLARWLTGADDAISVAATTYAIGRVMISYCQGMYLKRVPSDEHIKHLYIKALEHGRNLLSGYLTHTQIS